MQNGLNIQHTATDTTASIALKNQIPKAKLHPSEVPEADDVEKEASAYNRLQNPTSTANQDIDAAELENVLTQLNAGLSAINERYSFQVDQSTEQLVVQVKDQQGAVVRQIPPEAVLELASKIGRMIGVFLDEIA